MRVTELTREMMHIKKRRHELLRSGFECVDELGGRIWELHRGFRVGHKITACEIDPNGISVWVKVEKP